MRLILFLMLLTSAVITGPGSFRRHIVVASDQGGGLDPDGHHVTTNAGVIIDPNG
jgi:hypothetical protein